MISNCSFFGRRVLLAMAVSSLAACGGKGGSAGQSLVRVNGEEITIHQLNAEVGKMGGSANLPVKNLLDALVNRQLLVDAAKHDKVDVDPDVLTELERVRDQLLAQAYLNAKIGNISPPAKSEIDAFYRENPDVYGQRKQYDFNELVIAPKDMTPDVEAAMTGVKSLDDIAAFLDAKHIAYGRVQASRTSADLPQQMVASLKNMERGRLFVVKEGARTLLVSLQDNKPAPLTATAAAPQIEQLLIQKKSNDLIKDELDRLRQAATIEYLPRSEEILKAQVAEALAKPSAAASASASGEKAAQEGAHVSRGIAGLK